jgi:hypothetical protein
VVRGPERVLSLTAFNTLADVATFRRPWSMHPFSIRGIGEIYLRTMTRFALDLAKRAFELTDKKQRSRGMGAAHLPRPGRMG